MPTQTNGVTTFKIKTQQNRVDYPLTTVFISLCITQRTH